MNENDEKQTNAVPSTSTLSDYDLLKQLLSFTCREPYLSELTDRIIAEFHSIGNFFNAVALNREDVQWIETNVINFIHRITYICKYYIGHKNNCNIICDNIETIYKFIKPYYVCTVGEVLYAICLNANYRIIGCHKLSTEKFSNKNVSSTNYDFKEIMDISISCNASNVIFVHNHPSGNDNPSDGDREFTKKAKQLLEAVNIKLYDHFIITDDSFSSVLNANNKIRVSHNNNNSAQQN